MKKRFTEEQVIAILRQPDTDGVVIRDLCRKHNITEQTFFRWRNKFWRCEDPINHDRLSPTQDG